MGYYTRHKLIAEPNIIDDEFAVKFEEITELCLYDLDDEIKWYSYDEDMKTLSELYPDVLFTLDGIGETNGDIWRTYYKNGKSQECYATITLDDFDENKLK